MEVIPAEIRSTVGRVRRAGMVKIAVIRMLGEAIGSGFLPVIGCVVGSNVNKVAMVGAARGSEGVEFIRGASVELRAARRAGVLLRKRAGGQGARALGRFNRQPSAARLRDGAAGGDAAARPRLRRVFAGNRPAGGETEKRVGIAVRTGVRGGGRRDGLEKVLPKFSYLRNLQ